MENNKMIIAGAGIGGLTAALACLHHGFDVCVLEQATGLEAVGAGLQIPPNAMKVLRALGLEAEIERHGFLPQALQARMGETGRQLFRVPLDEAAQHHWGAPYYHIHRADYVAVLKTALLARAPEALIFDASVARFENQSHGVQVTLDDGRQFFGAALIGADGIHSTLQQQMFGPQKPVFTGNVAWRAVVPVARLGAHAPEANACVWMGRGRHGVTYRLGHGLANFVGVVERDDWQVESWRQAGSQADALADFAGWHPIVTTLIEQADTLHRWALFDRAPLASWVQGRVALLGDAAHPMLPFMAQGAAMAVEDAWVLASTLRDVAGQSGDVHAALRAYEAKRQARASAAQAASRANAKTFHQANFLGQLKTYGPMWLGGKLAPKQVRGRLDWLYRHDVTTT
ncbi:FAD-dependent monooxygenase [Alphaproteobacteria bacterium]|nr:FAD-dependent monooxygenase [Alphaproteobacteria bacterium]MDC1241116.1 FAD-dependent monooxygenase [bacterium]